MLPVAKRQNQLCNKSDADDENERRRRLRQRLGLNDDDKFDDDSDDDYDNEYSDSNLCQATLITYNLVTRSLGILWLVCRNDNTMICCKRALII